MVSLSNLKRKEIRKIIKVGNDEIKIFNPNKKIKAELSKVIFENMNPETGEINIDPYKTLTIFMRSLTDIEIPEDEQLIQEVLDDESDELGTVFMEINDIINQITNTYVKTMINLKNTSSATNLPVDTLIQIVEKQNELKELEKQLKNEKEKKVEEIDSKPKRGRRKGSKNKPKVVD